MKWKRFREAQISGILKTAEVEEQAKKKEKAVLLFVTHKFMGQKEMTECEWCSAGCRRICPMDEPDTSTGVRH